MLVIIISEIMIFTGTARECFIERDETLISEQGPLQPDLLPLADGTDCAGITHQQFDTVNTLNNNIFLAQLNQQTWKFLL